VRGVCVFVWHKTRRPHRRSDADTLSNLCGCHLVTKTGGGIVRSTTSVQEDRRVARTGFFVLSSVFKERDNRARGLRCRLPDDSWSEPAILHRMVLQGEEVTYRASTGSSTPGPKNFTSTMKTALNWGFRA
jgi:hypothetical protein